MAPDDLATDPRWQLAQRVAESASFKRSGRLRDFLLYVCDRALRQQTDEIREQTIGVRVFGRDPDYSPGDDNIVRVEASTLRRRLDTYFRDLGQEEPFRIEIPRGSYVPIFVPREPVAPPRRARLAVRPRAIAWAVAGVLLAGSFGALWFRNQALQEDLNNRRGLSPVLNPLLALVFDRKHQTRIVAADSDWALAQDVMQRAGTLAGYVSRDFAGSLSSPTDPEALRSAVRLITTRQHTSLADLILAVKITRATPSFWDRTSISFARELQVRDLKSVHLILLGSLRANPWMELFEKRLNFVWRRSEGVGQPYFLNRSPLPGELPLYRTGGEDGHSDEVYGAVAFLPNLSEDGNVLILAGARMESTEALGELVMNEQLSLRLLHGLGLMDAQGHVKYFEVLFRSTRVGSSAREPVVVAHRVITEAGWRAAPVQPHMR